MMYIVKPKSIVLQIHFNIKEKGGQLIKGIYRLLKITQARMEMFKKKLQWEEKEIRDNVLFVNHGIMIHEIAPMIHEIAPKRKSVIKRMFSPCMTARITTVIRAWLPSVAKM